MRYLLIFLLLSSCSAERQANRLIRHAKKDIDKATLLGFPPKVDTIFLTKIVKGDSTTIKVPYDRFIHSLKDTVIFQDKIKIHYRTVHDTVRVKVECPPDTIRIPVTIHKSIICPPITSFWKSFGIASGVFSILLLLALFLAFRRAQK